MSFSTLVVVSEKFFYSQRTGQGRSYFNALKQERPKKRPYPAALIGMILFTRLLMVILG